MLELETRSAFVENYSTPFLVMEMNLLRSQFFFNSHIQLFFQQRTCEIPQRENLTQQNLQ